VESYIVANPTPYGSLALSYGNDIGLDVVKFNPVDIQFVMDGLTEDNEEFPGRYILYNKDDDDDDGVVDYNDGFNEDTEDDNEDDENTAEDDLVKITLRDVQPNDYMTGTVTFDVTSGDSKVKVWKSKTKGEGKEINLPTDYNTPNDLAKELWVEGIDESGGPRDVEFTLSYTVGGKTFEDVIKATIVHVELFRDSDYTQPLDDHPKPWPKPTGPDLLRSPKYLFGEDDPIYVQVKNIGTDPDVAESIYAAVAVKSPLSPHIYISLQETGADTEVFTNLESGELLYISDGTDIDNKKTMVLSEEVLYFWLRIPPIGGGYKMSEDVMVDRAEIGVEWQQNYSGWGCECIPWNPRSHYFGPGFFENSGGEPNLVWFKNFHEPDQNSLLSHWHEDTDTPFADSVDMISWSGHRANGSQYRTMHFFKEDRSCETLELEDTMLGNTDADWVIFDTCHSLVGDVNTLKNELVSSVSGERCAHLFLGFYYCADWKFSDCGEYFANRLKEVGIKQAWFDYCLYRQPSGSVVRVFGAEDCMDDSVAGPGPTEVSRDPTKDSIWDDDFKTKP
jgi:hypothetical protein